MPVLARLVLLATAGLCGAFAALLGGGFSRAVEPESYTTSTSMFWLLAATIFTAPLWVPASIPNRYPFAQMICRWIGAAALVFPISMFGGIVVHNVSRSISGLGVSPLALTQGLVLTLLCVACSFILIWPELKRYAERAA